MEAYAGVHPLGIGACVLTMHSPSCVQNSCGLCAGVLEQLASTLLNTPRPDEQGNTAYCKAQDVVREQKIGIVTGLLTPSVLTEGLIL